MNAITLLEINFLFVNEMCFHFPFLGSLFHFLGSLFHFNRTHSSLKYYIQLTIFPWTNKKWNYLIVQKEKKRITTMATGREAVPLVCGGRWKPIGSHARDETSSLIPFPARAASPQGGTALHSSCMTPTPSPHCTPSQPLARHRHRHRHTISTR
jgi:hypothetical protein